MASCLLLTLLLPSPPPLQSPSHPFSPPCRLQLASLAWCSSSCGRREMKLGPAKLLVLTILQAEISLIYSITSNESSDNIAILPSSDEEAPDINNPNQALLPYVPDDNNSGRSRRSIQKRSTAGRAVTIPSVDVEKMANVPMSALSPDLPEVQAEILESHNKYRRQAQPTASNMLKMVWSPEAAKTAQAWAKQCKQGHSPQVERTIPDFKCGENIFYFNYLVPWYAVIDAWYSEYVDFKYGHGATSDAETGHYTQVMWAKSFGAGCAMTECTNGPAKYLYVCHYAPSGNKGSVANPWKEGKPCADCPNSCDNKLCTNPCKRQDMFNNCVSYQVGCTKDVSMRSDKCYATCQCTRGEIY